MANQAWQITSPSVLTLTTLSDTPPSPGPNEVLVRIHAVSINSRDFLVVDHCPLYPLATGADLVPCSDGVGTVEGVGTSSKWKKGDRVIIHPNTWTTGSDIRNFRFAEVMGGGAVDGTLRRWMLADEARLTKAPEGLSIEEAATVYTAGVTAFHALYYDTVPVHPGMTILTQGTGGVSCYAIMIAAAAGATVIATSSSDEKLQLARKLGATHLVNYRKTPDWAAEVLKLTNGNGVDHVVDVVGAGSIEQTLKATRRGGLVTVIGMLSGDKPVTLMAEILFGAKTLRGILGAGSQEMCEALCGFMEKHNLHPPLAHVFEFEQAREAFEEARILSVAGKVVVRC